jgi:aspartyl protease family protein
LNSIISSLRIGSAIAAFFVCSLASASDISVVGLFPGKAVLVVNGGAPKTYSVGNTVTDGIKLTAVSQSGATFETNGKRQTIAIGEHVNRSVSSGPAQVVLKADSSGHFMAQGQINGGIARMMVDTGATLIAMPASDAIRLGVDYRKGEPTLVSTANGTAPAYRVKLNTVKIGDIQMNQVDALVQESGLPIILLGMSFLNRTEMKREGDQMTLIKRY